MKTLVNLLFTIVVISTAIIFFGCEQITDLIESTTINKSGDQAFNKAYQTRPFTGEIIYTFMSQVNDSVSIYNGTGNVTHMGYCSVLDTTTHHFTLTGLTVEGSDWVTAANGSIIHLTWFMDYYDPTTWVWEITGGTGRFTGAYGNGTFTAAFTSTGDLWVRFTGTITY